MRIYEFDFRFTNSQIYSPIFIPFIKTLTKKLTLPKFCPSNSMPIFVSMVNARTLFLLIISFFAGKLIQAQVQS